MPATQTNSVATDRLTEAYCKNGRWTVPAFQIGDRVEYKSNAGNVAVYYVRSKGIEEIMYGPQRGSRYRYVSLGRTMNENEKTFNVSAKKVKLVF